MGIDLNRPFSILDLILVKRQEWEALPSKCVERYSEYPINWVVNRFTETEECFSREECTRVLQELQRREMEQGLPDITHNFMVGGDWAVYEGRGWRYVPGDPPQEDLRGVFVDVSYIGPSPQLGQRNYPSIEMKHAKQRILEFGIRRGYLDSNFNQENQDRKLNAPCSKPLGDPSWQ